MNAKPPNAQPRPQSQALLLFHLPSPAQPQCARSPRLRPSLPCRSVLLSFNFLFSCEELCLSNLKSEIPLGLSHSCNSCAFVVQSSRPDQFFRPRAPTTCPFLAPPVFLKGVIAMTYKRISPARHGQIRPPIGQKPARKGQQPPPKTSKRPLNWSR